MPVTFDKRNKRWRYHFDRVIKGERKRASRLLPKGFSREDALEYDAQTTKETFQVASGLRRKVRLIDDAVLLYLTDKTHLKNHGNLIIQLKQCAPFYAGKRLDQLDEVAADYRQNAKRSDGSDKPLGAATIRNRLAYLAAACRYAWKKGKGFWCDHDPAEKVVMPVVNNKRHYYLNRRQMLQIARYIKNRQARAACWIAFFSGMRQAEVRNTGLGYETYDIPKELSKTGLPRNVPVHPKMKRLLASEFWPIQITTWTISHHFKSAARAAGLGHLRFHDLRHSTASEMINNGVDLFTVGQVLGHMSTQSTQRYAHLAQATLKEAVNSVGKNHRTKPAAKKSKP